jgi:hypothetical protein
MKNLKDKLEEFLAEVYSDVQYEDISYYQDFEDIEDIDELLELVENKCLEWIETQEVIYFSDAINYLVEHDPSLISSTGLAGELGYDIEDVNSEILATLLLQDNLKDQLFEDIELLRSILEQ